MYRGIFIFQNIKEELIEILSEDAAIKNNLLAYDIFNWYGSASLSDYLPFSEKIWNLKP
jgi:hypothetical protein